MKSFVALTVGLTGTGAGTAFSDLALALPNAIQSYVRTFPEPGPVEMLAAGFALMLFVAMRKKPKIR